MVIERFKSLCVAAFSLLILTFSNTSFAQEYNDHEKTNNDAHYETEDHKGGEGEEHGEGNKFDADKVIFGHVMDAHEFHFFSWTDGQGKEHHATIPLPVILYSPQKGLSVFSSSAFHHGEHAHEGYQLVTQHYKENLKTKGMREDEIQLLSNEKIIAVNEQGLPDNSIQVYDFSLTRNVVQMFIATAVLILLMTSIAKRYKEGQGVTRAPKGIQNAIEPVITFIRDEVAKPNLGHKYQRFMPFLLTVFFFILINTFFGLIPGSANVTGNIAFTAVLGVISFIVINVNGNKHYWGHIVNPPVPFGIKFIMVPVEILSIFTKAFALIIRLFANMLAGHIIIICLISLIFIFSSISTVAGVGFSPISIAFAAFIYVIEILVAFIQAFIFTNLTAVFIGQAIEEGHHGEHKPGHAEDTLAPTEPVIL